MTTLAITNPTEESTFREATIRTELQELSREIADYAHFRDYYEGEQPLNMGTEKFRERFGAAYPGLCANVCRVVVDAVEEKMELIGLRIGRSREDIDQFRPASERIWRAMLDNNIDDEQIPAHQGAFVEGRSAVIVWPDPRRGVILRWNTAGEVRVRYDDETREPIWAVKRWRTPTGAVYVNYYTPTFLYKYVAQRGSPFRSDRQVTPLDQIVTEGGTGGLTPREVPGESWPLPNPLHRIPVVEFYNRGGVSELADIVPLQDAINFVLVAQAVAAEFQAHNQRLIVTRQAEPKGGWNPDPGTVWHFEPMPDTEGRLVMPVWGEFRAGDPAPYSEILNQYLQQVANVSQTPNRYFFKTDRSGRGDAPSGESLKVEDKPLLDKVRNRSTSFGNSWYEVVRLVADSLRFSGEREIPPGEDLPYGEMVWRDQHLEYQSAALADAAQMVKLGLPAQFIWKKIGLSPEEYEEAVALAEEEEKEQEAAEQARMEAMAQAGTEGPAAPPGQINRPPQGRTGPRPSNL